LGGLAGTFAVAGTLHFAAEEAAAEEAAAEEAAAAASEGGVAAWRLLGVAPLETRSAFRAGAPEFKLGEDLPSWYAAALHLSPALRAGAFEAMCSCTTLYNNKGCP
jgi:hypothetical protein